MNNKQDDGFWEAVKELLMPEPGPALPEHFERIKQFLDRFPESQTHGTLEDFKRYAVRFVFSEVIERRMIADADSEQ
jgi:hypothetical protein